jgi:predicted nucleic acid-binding protein
VIKWLADVDEDRVYVSVASLAELRAGVELLPGGRRKQRLDVWVRDELPVRFETRILDIDRHVAHEWGNMIARAQHAGVALSSMDAFFAATAAAHGLTLVTRNVRDFELLDIPLFDPWA